MPLRDHFPIFQTKTYLNSCSHGALSKEVRAAYLSYLEDRDRRGADWEDWVGKQEVLRGALARLLNAAPGELALVSCLSNGLNALASALDFSGPRNKVLVTDFDFPTTTQIWRAQESRGAVIESVPCFKGELTIPTERFAECLDESTPNPVPAAGLLPQRGQIGCGGHRQIGAGEGGRGCSWTATSPSAPCSSMSRPWMWISPPAAC